MSIMDYSIRGGGEGDTLGDAREGGKRGREGNLGNQYRSRIIKRGETPN